MARAVMAEREPVDLASERFVPVVEAARYLGICRAKVYTLMDAGAIRYAKFGKSRRIPVRELLEYADRCMVG